ncbi:extracellular solute-binding protein [Paenibacillus chungangensis]|uniref:Extracellular solute-binding protein n=1 Tax=Paenibacillus chungangensis TaxID=696535 RepID=A0ABW3HLW0_9BACL
MRRKLKNFVVWTIMGALVLTAAACGNDSNTDKGTNSNSQSNREKQENIQEEGNKEKTKLSLFIVSRSPESLYSNETLTWKTIGEKFNVEFDFITGDNTTMSEKFRFTMASGDYPDIVAGQLKDINMFGKEGAFIPLNALIEQHSPSIKKHVIDDKDAFMQTSDDEGNIYAVPMMSAIRTSTGSMIRQDWLDRLNLPVPDTIEDWHRTLKAFKEQDANGNGDPNDEIPFASEAQGHYFMGFLDAWGLNWDWDNRWTEENGKMIYTPTDPRFKAFLETMHSWYEEGLLDKELMTRQKTDLDTMILNDRVGSTNHWIGHIAGFKNKPEAQKIDGFNYQSTPPVILNKGDKPLTHKQQKSVIQLGWGITANNKHVDLTMKIFEYVNSDEGQILFNFGKEGDTYTLDAEGNYQYTDKVTDSPDGIYNGLLRFGGQAWVGFRQHPQYEKLIADEDSFNQMYNYIEKDYFHPAYPTLKYASDDIERYGELTTQINTFVDEKVAKFVIGQEPISKFDDFVKQLQKLKLDELQQIQDRTYESYQAMISN